MKTYKREVAVILLVWMAYIVEVKETNLVEILVWPVFSFAAAAFGFDQYSKLHKTSGLSGRGDKRSSEHTSGADK